MLFLPALFVVAGQAENLVVDTPSTPMAISATRSGKVLATLLPDGDVRLWRFDNPRKVGRLTAYFHPSLDANGYPGNEDVVMSPNGALLLVYNQLSAELWQAQPPIRLRQLSVRDGGVEDVEWTPDSRTVMISAGRQTSVMPVHGPVTTLPGASALGFSPDGKSVVEISRTGADEFSLQTHRLLRHFASEVPLMGPVVFSPDGKFLVTGSEDPAWQPPDSSNLPAPPTESFYAHTVKLAIWDVRRQKRLKLIESVGNQSSPPAVHFLSPTRFAVQELGAVYACPSGTILKRFEFDEFKPAFRSTADKLMQRLPGAASTVNAMVVSGDGTKLVINGPNMAEWSLHPLRIDRTWPMPTPKQLRVAGGPLSMTLIRPVKLYFTKKGKLVSWGYRGSLIFPKNGNRRPEISTQTLTVDDRVVRNPQTADTPLNFRLPNGETIPVPTNLKVSLFSEDGSAGLAVRSGLPTSIREFSAFQPATGKVLWTRSDIPPGQLPQLSPDGRFIATATSEVNNGKMAFAYVLLDGRTGATLRTLPTAFYTGGIEFSPDGTKLAARERSSLRLLDTGTFQNVWEVPEVLVSGQEPMRFSPNGRRLLKVGTTRGPEVASYDTSTGRVTARLLRFGTSDWVAWTPDGAVAGTKQGLGHLYRMRNGKVDRLSQQVHPEKVAAALTG